MGEQIIGKVSEYIDAIAAGLGVAAAHVYEVMARQMFAEGIVYTLLSLIIISILTWAIVKLARITVISWDEICSDDREFTVSVAWLFGGVASLFILGACVVSLPDAIMKLVNPEYYVIRDLLDIVKGAAN